MIRLLLFRHAKAVRDASGGDKDRALDKSGRTAAADMGAWLQARRLLPDLALVSDSRRTRETFELASKSFDPAVRSRLEPSLYGAGAETLLRIVRNCDPALRSLMLVGHNPGLAELAVHLAQAGEQAEISALHRSFPPGSIAIFRFDAPGWMDVKAGNLERFATPASLS